MTNGLDEKQILDQANKISEINDKLKLMNQYTKRSKKNHHHHDHHIFSGNFRILSSAEVNIMKDGSLDIANNVLDKLDIVGGSNPF